MPVEESLNLSCCRFGALKSVPTGQNRLSDSRILGKSDKSLELCGLSELSVVYCDGWSEGEERTFSPQLSNIPWRRWKMSRLATSALQLVTLPSSLSSRCLSLQLEEQNPSPPSAISDVTVPLSLLLLIYNWVYGSSWWRAHVTVWAFLANTAGRTTHALFWILMKSQTAFRLLGFSLTREDSGDRYMLTVTTLQVKPSWLSWVSPSGRNTLKYIQPQSKMIPAIRVWAPTRFWNTKKRFRVTGKLTHTCTHAHAEGKNLLTFTFV